MVMATIGYVAGGNNSSGHRLAGLKMSTEPLMLTVSGLRGIAGTSLTSEVACRYAESFGIWLKGTHQSDAPVHIVVGRDSRASGQELELAVVAGLTNSGCQVTRLGIATTPGVAIMTMDLHATGGMVITASHNPAPWNGIKLLRPDGAAPTANQAEQIIAQYHRTLPSTHINESCSIPVNPNTVEIHVKKILGIVDTALIQKQRFKVVLDSLHGSGGPSTSLLLERLGVDLVHRHAEPTGQFPHPPEPTAKNLGEFCHAVRQANCDIGFAQDPDADRLAIVDETGRYIGEEYTLALCAMHLTSRQQARTPKVLVTNLSTSRMIDDIAASFNATVKRTAVGEANVADALRDYHGLLGGEGNGGVILPAISYVRDSLVGITLILQMLAERGQRLSQIIDSMQQYTIVKERFEITDTIIERLEPTMRSHFSNHKIDARDGVRVDWPDRWVHVRASNTEPIIRVIAEATDPSTSRALVQEVGMLLTAQSN